MQTPNLCPKSWLSTLDFPTLILLPFIIYKRFVAESKTNTVVSFQWTYLFLQRLSVEKKICKWISRLLNLTRMQFWGLYVPWFSFLPLNEIHCAFQGYNFISTEARLMGEESNFTTFAHSRIMCWFKMKPHYRFYCLFPHYIYSVLQINDLLW